MKILNIYYDAHSAKTHAQISTHEFTDWYWVSGYATAEQALQWLRPAIEAQLADFAIGLADTPHEIQSSGIGLL